ncbi:MAG: peptide chain release factor 1 [Proteobacteria bacterium]|nr:peptide chain release factor 1 [Pseudomonadota bacterium]
MLDKLAAVESRYEQLNEKMCDPVVISNTSEYRKVSRERAEIEEIVTRFREYKALLDDAEGWRSLAEADKDMRAEAETELRALEARKPDLEARLQQLLLPRDPNDDKNVIVEVRAGTGGEEAALFAAELFRMYARYAEQRGWKVELMDANPTELGGYKEAVFAVNGQGAYSRLKHESGVHRVQRVPATESSGRIHTSTVTVAVLPEVDDVTEVPVNEVDLKIDVYRASGAGGQHVNKTESAVRITHLPTGIVVACQDERSQHQNRDKAMRVLRAKLLEAERIRQESEIASNRKSQVGTGERSEKIRTYNFKENRITDHRINLTMHNLPAALEGDLDDVIEALVANEQKERLAEASAEAVY